MSLAAAWDDLCDTVHNTSGLRWSKVGTKGAKYLPAGDQEKVMGAARFGGLVLDVLARMRGLILTKEAEAPASTPMLRE